MPDKNTKKTFKVNGGVYDIPISEVDAFLSENKGAIQLESYTLNRDTFDIPLNEVDAFLSENPKAKPTFMTP